MDNRFPPLASQEELDAERREILFRRAARIAEGVSLAVIFYALFVFAGVMQ